MKTVFIVNPCAGQGKNINKISKAIDMAASSVGADYEIYITKSIGDATTFIIADILGVHALLPVAVMVR